MKTKIWAHRGSSAYAPENTLKAFALAMEQGADGIELDVRLTADDQIVIAHDDRLDRISDGDGKICEKTLAQLREYDFSKLHPEYSPVRIATLAEVYELLRPSNMIVNVEIKTSSYNYKRIEPMLIAMERDMGMSGRILYSDFNHYGLTEIRAIDPTARIGLLYSIALVNPHLYAKSVGADAVHPLYSTLQYPGIWEGCRESGILVHPWTVDDPDLMRSMIQQGANAIITNKPDLALQIRDEEF